MATYVIVGAGAAGLYTAYRLLTSGKLEPDDSVQLYEWSGRVGGRIYTYSFPDSPDGLYVELGGMRFLTDQHFPERMVEGHRLVQRVIRELGLQDKVVPFSMSSDRMYYLRGRTTYEKDLTSTESVRKLGYNTNGQFDAVAASLREQHTPQTLTADNVLSEVAAAFGTPGGLNGDRGAWCSFFQSGTVDPTSASAAYPPGTPVHDIGYWNLLYDRLGDEGFDYAADGNGYTSNVINWNTAAAFQANGDYGSNVVFSRLDGGYSVLMDTLHLAVEKAMAERNQKSAGPPSRIVFNTRLTGLLEAPDGKTVCGFDGKAVVTADHLFLAMPRKSLEMVAAGCLPGHLFREADFRLNLEASIDQPAIKVVMTFDTPWWTTAPHAPRLDAGVGGPTITDLPLRMIYYFGNNVPGGQGAGGDYALLASYDDMSYSNFWRELEIAGDATVAPSLAHQPLAGPTQVGVESAFGVLLMKQLAEAHGMEAGSIPAPTSIYYQDWGQEPFGGGYHAWAPHYDICGAMRYMRAPYHASGSRPVHNVYIVGSCYSIDQAWVEGAFCTAESVLQDYLGLAPLSDTAGYTLLCGRES